MSEIDRGLLVVVRSLMSGDSAGPWPLEVTVVNGPRIGLLRRRGPYIEAKPVVWADSRTTRDRNEWTFAEERAAVEALIQHYLWVVTRLN